MSQPTLNGVGGDVDSVPDIDTSLSAHVKVHHHHENRAKAAKPAPKVTSKNGSAWFGVGNVAKVQQPIKKHHSHSGSGSDKVDVHGASKGKDFLKYLPHHHHKQQQQQSSCVVM